MPDGQVLEFAGVTKQFGTVTAVSDFSARVEPGIVSGFLGPNGAGKTTTLRILLGLVRATSGTATIGGVPYAGLREPLQSVGAVLEASSFHPGRSAANHLKIYAQAAGLPTARVDEVLGTVGLAGVAGNRVGGFSLGMKQRLSLAYALLGDPGVLILDEPANGLDPEGIIWMRSLLRELARQGRTVLVSSHLLAEVQQTVDALLIIAQGRLVFEGALDDLTDPEEFVTVVDSPDRAALARALRAAGADFELLRSGITVRSAGAAEVGEIAATAGVGLSLLQRRGPGLEEIFLDLVSGTRVHGGGRMPVQGSLLQDDPSTGSAHRESEPGDDASTGSAHGESVPRDDASTGSATGESGSATGERTEERPPGAPAAWPIGPGANLTAAQPAEADLDQDDAASEPPARPGFAVASTGVIDIVSAQTDAEAPEYFASQDTVLDLAPGAAPDDADPSTDDIIVPASEASDAPDDESDREVEPRHRRARWEAQFDPVLEPDADDEVSDSDREAEEFFGASDADDGRRSERAKESEQR